VKKLGKVVSQFPIAAMKNNAHLSQVGCGDNSQELARFEQNGEKVFDGRSSYAGIGVGVGVGVIFRPGEPKGVGVGVAVGVGV